MSPSSVNVDGNGSPCALAQGLCDSLRPDDDDALAVLFLASSGDLSMLTLLVL